jgi:hypothetical protein
MKTKPEPQTQLQSIDAAQLDTVVGGCACGCGQASCSCTGGGCGQAPAATTNPAFATNPAFPATRRPFSWFR